MSIRVAPQASLNVGKYVREQNNFLEITFLCLAEEKSIKNIQRIYLLVATGTMGEFCKEVETSIVKYYFPRRDIYFHYNNARFTPKHGMLHLYFKIWSFQILQNDGDMWSWKMLLRFIRLRISIAMEIMNVHVTISRPSEFRKHVLPRIVKIVFSTTASAKSTIP